MTSINAASKNFDPKKEVEHITEWIRGWFNGNGRDAAAVIGISGGKDSTIAAALLARALGPGRVMGVMLPNIEQPDIGDSRRVTGFLGIRSMEINIGPAANALYASLISAIALANEVYDVKMDGLSESARVNTPPRVRMAMLYAVAQSMPCGGRVCNTCNASEDYIGYSTKYGDAAGDFAPLARYTVTEILEIGEALGLPRDLVFKTPSDGLCGMSDEDRFGFTYAVLDRYIRTGRCDDAEVRTRIDRMHAANLHKLEPIPACRRLCDV